MDENLEWTQQLGAAFALQPAALLTGTQRLRASAIAAGNLKTTPQQTVIVEKEVVRIVPAQREIIFVPVYDPYWVYRPGPAFTYHHPRSLITFSSGYRTGVWLFYHFNWGSSAIVTINRPYRTVVWHNYPAWHYPSHTVVHHHHVWRPSPVVVHRVRHDYHRRPVVHVARPTVNLHAQRNTTRNVNINREVNINRDRNITINRDRDITLNRERDVTLNRERNVNRPANTRTRVTNPAPAPERRRDVTPRNPEEIRRQTRPENLRPENRDATRDATRAVTRDIVRRPETNAPSAAPARPIPQNRPVLTTPRPAPSRPAITPAQNPLTTRGGPPARPAPSAQTAPRIRPATTPEAIRPQRQNPPARVQPSAGQPQPVLEEQTGRGGPPRSR